jgi:hypothetical protein
MEICGGEVPGFAGGIMMLPIPQVAIEDREKVREVKEPVCQRIEGSEPADSRGKH